MDGRLFRSRFVLFFCLTSIGASLDLVTKSMVFSRYFDPEKARSGEPQTEYWVIDEIFGIETSTNAGALFGMGQGYSWLFAIFSLVAIVGILSWLFAFRAAQDRWLTISLGLITGGILGNLYDRLGFGWSSDYPDTIRTHVRDFILFHLENVPLFDPWPNFNIADSLLVTGAAMLFIHAVFFVESQPAKPVENSEIS